MGLDIGFKRKVKGIPLPRQEAALLEYGVRPELIYDNLDDAINRLRKDDPGNMVIAGPLNILTTRQKDLAGIVAEVRSRGGEVIDCVNGHSTEGSGFDMMLKFLNVTANEFRFGNVKQASRAGVEKQYGALHQKRAANYGEAYAIFWDVSLTTPQVAEKLKPLGWSLQAAYGDPKKRKRGLRDEEFNLPARKGGRKPKPWK